MASVRTFPDSRFFYACFTSADGRRLQRSTKQSDRKKAQRVADKFEEAAKLGSEKRLGEAQARRVLSEIYQHVNNEVLPSATTREFFNGWTERRKGDTSPRTHQAYAQVTRDFVASLGDRANRDISQVSRSDVARFRDIVQKRTSTATANKSLKYLRVALGAAYKDGLIQDNPAAKLNILKRREGDAPERRPFTVPEMRLLLKHASDSWRGLILFGLYTGQRLKDIASLTWASVDLQEKELRFVTSKTGKRLDLPLGAPLLAYLQILPAGDDPSEPLFPDAYAIATSESGDSRLSQQFHSILVSAGMAKARRKDETGNGRNRRRTINEISFHSLRHSATTLFKMAGVPESVAMEIIGHDSKAMSQHYTHVDMPNKRAAMAKLPDITSTG